MLVEVAENKGCIPVDARIRPRKNFLDRKDWEREKEGGVQQVFLGSPEKNRHWSRYATRIDAVDAAGM